MTLYCSAFYKFVGIDDPAGLRPTLLAACAAREIKGSILLAHEGINGTISGDAGKLSDFSPGCAKTRASRTSKPRNRPRKSIPSAA